MRALILVTIILMETMTIPTTSKFAEYPKKQVITIKSFDFDIQHSKDTSCIIRDTLR